MSIWTAIPYFSNINLPLDTIEALAWGSDLKWGYSKHPPLSAFFAETFFQIFGNQDWAFYLLSQIFVLTAFIAIFELSNSLLENKQENFFEEEIYLREQKNLPPFSRLIAFIISAKNPKLSKKVKKIKASISAKS